MGHLQTGKTHCWIHYASSSLLVACDIEHLNYLNLLHRWSSSSCESNNFRCTMIESPLQRKRSGSSYSKSFTIMSTSTPIRRGTPRKAALRSPYASKHVCTIHASPSNQLSTTLERSTNAVFEDTGGANLSTGHRSSTYKNEEAAKWIYTFLSSCSVLKLRSFARAWNLKVSARSNACTNQKCLFVEEEVLNAVFGNVLS